MAFKVRDPVRNKIVINNNFVEQKKTFIYTICTIRYQNDKDITVKLSKFLQRTGIIKEILQQSQFYNSLNVTTVSILQQSQFYNSLNFITVSILQQFQLYNSLNFTTISILQQSQFYNSLNFTTISMLQKSQFYNSLNFTTVSITKTHQTEN